MIEPKLVVRKNMRYLVVGKKRYLIHGIKDTTKILTEILRILKLMKRDQKRLKKKRKNPTKKSDKMKSNKLNSSNPMALQITWRQVIL
jgi:hypothetical protein